jgi:sigma-B regulation protein RsbU (phosphoserine phosphatase)
MVFEFRANSKNKINLTHTTPNSSLTLKHLELDALLDLTNAINRQMDEASLFKIYLFTLVANFKIERLMLYEQESEKWTCKLRHGIENDYFPHSEELIQVFETNTFLNFNDTEFRTINSNFDVSVPVFRDGKLQATVLLGSRKKFSEDAESVKFIQTISNILFVAIQNSRLTQEKIKQEALKNELEVARKLQSLLFPQYLPNEEHLKVNATYIPHQSVGGDYYDYIPLPSGDFMVCIADVSGKGISAAFIMSNFQAALRVLARQGMPMEEIVKELNTLVYNNTKGEKFVTFFIAKYIPRKNMLIYVNCGHNPPLIISESKHIETLDKGSMILGIMPDLPFIDTGKIYNISHSVLFSYTDGLVESFEKTNTDFGVEIIKNNLVKHDSLYDLHHNILHEMNLENASFDDITMLSCYFSNDITPVED